MAGDNLLQQQQAAAGVQPQPHAAPVRTGVSGASPEAAAQVLKMLEGMRAVTQGDKAPQSAPAQRTATKPNSFGQSVAALGQRIFGAPGAPGAENPEAGLYEVGNFVTPAAPGAVKTQREQILERTLQILPKMLSIDVRSFNKHTPGMNDYVDQPPTVLRTNLQNLAVALMFGADRAELKRLMPILEKIYKRIAYLEQNSKPPYVAARPCKDLNQRLGLQTADHPMVMPVGS